VNEQKKSYADLISDIEEEISKIRKLIYEYICIGDLKDLEEARTLIALAVLERLRKEGLNGQDEDSTSLHQT